MDALRSHWEIQETTFACWKDVAPRRKQVGRKIKKSSTGKQIMYSSIQPNQQNMLPFATGRFAFQPSAAKWNRLTVEISFHTQVCLGWMNCKQEVIALTQMGRLSNAAGAGIKDNPRSWKLPMQSEMSIRTIKEATKQMQSCNGIDLVIRFQLMYHHQVSTAYCMPDYQILASSALAHCSKLVFSNNLAPMREILGFKKLGRFTQGSDRSTGFHVLGPESKACSSWIRKRPWLKEIKLTDLPYHYVVVF